MNTTVDTTAGPATVGVAVTRAAWLASVRRRWPDGRVTPLAGALAAHTVGDGSDADAVGPLAVALDLPAVVDILQTACLVPAGLHGQLLDLVGARLLRWDQPPTGQHWGHVVLTGPAGPRPSGRDAPTAALCADQPNRRRP